MEGVHIDLNGWTFGGAFFPLRLSFFYKFVFSVFFISLLVPFLLNCKGDSESHPPHPRFDSLRGAPLSPRTSTPPG